MPIKLDGPETLPSADPASSDDSQALGVNVGLDEDDASMELPAYTSVVLPGPSSSSDPSSSSAAPAAFGRARASAAHKKSPFKSAFAQDDDDDGGEPESAAEHFSAASGPTIGEEEEEVLPTIPPPSFVPYQASFYVTPFIHRDVSLSNSNVAVTDPPSFTRGNPFVSGRIGAGTSAVAWGPGHEHDGGVIVSHDEHLNNDGEALYRFLLEHGQRAPGMRLRVIGSHPETQTRTETIRENGRMVSKQHIEIVPVLDFDFSIPLNVHVDAEGDTYCHFGTVPTFFVHRDDTLAHRGGRSSALWAGADKSRDLAGREVKLKKGDKTKVKLDMDRDRKKGIPPWEWHNLPAQRAVKAFQMQQTQQDVTRDAAGDADTELGYGRPTYYTDDDDADAAALDSDTVGLLAAHRDDPRPNHSQAQHQGQSRDRDSADGRLSHRQTSYLSAIPGTLSPTLHQRIVLPFGRTIREVADDYCASTKPLKRFEFEKIVGGWDFELVKNEVTSIIRETNYAGNLDIRFVTHGDRIRVLPSTRFSKMMNLRQSHPLWVFAGIVIVFALGVVGTIAAGIPWLVLIPVGVIVISLTARYVLEVLYGAQWDTAAVYYTFTHWEVVEGAETIEAAAAIIDAKFPNTPRSSPPSYFDDDNRGPYARHDYSDDPQSLDRPDRGWVLKAGPHGHPSVLALRGLREGDWLAQCRNVIRNCALERMVRGKVLNAVHAAEIVGGSRSASGRDAYTGI